MPRVVAALLLPLSTGCFTAGYLAQAAGGQFELLHGARPLREVISDQEVSPRIRALLARVDGIKAYGMDHGLKPTRNYDRYTELRRPAAVWVVQGCAPLEFEVRRWSFPLVGSVPYLGFFAEARARAYAESLAAAEALDVDVRTASAYSTLGWFRDPVLSTMISDGDEALGGLVNVVLHESVHATLYLKSQSAFDESLASFVADRLTLAWLVEHRGPTAPETKAWTAAEARHRVTVERLHGTWVELDALYRSSASDDEKRASKARVLAQTSAELKLTRPINNATLAGYETYATGGAAFERLLGRCDGSLRRMMSALASLAESDFARPQQETYDDVVDRLAQRGCGPTGRGAPTRR